MFCTNCGKQIADDAQFCPECGAAVIPAAQIPETEPETPPQDAPVAQEPSEAPEIPETPVTPEVPETPEAPEAPEAAQPMELPVFEPYQPEQAAEGAEPTPEATPEDDVPPVPPKKSRAGLVIGIIAAVVILGGILLAGLLTNWFGLAAGPGDKIVEAFQNNSSQTCMTVDMDLKLKQDGEKAGFAGTLTVTEDPENREIAFLFEGKVKNGFYSMDMTIGVNDGYMLIGVMGQYVWADIHEQMDEIWKQYDEEQAGEAQVEDIDWEQVIEQLRKQIEQIDDEAWEEMTAHVNLNELVSCLSEYGAHFNDRQWLEEYAGYEEKDDGDQTLHCFDPFSKEFLMETLRAFRTVFVDEAEYNSAMEDLEETDFGDLDAELVFGITDRMLTELGIEVSAEDTEVEFTFGFSDFGTAKVDTEYLDELREQAEEVDAADLGLGA